MLKAGFSRLEITPPLGTFVAGAFRDRFAKDVLDPLQLNTLAVSDGTETALIIAADFLQMAKKYADEIRKLISERVNIPEKNIMVACLHQHTSTVLKEHHHPHGILDDRSYMDLLYRKFADAAELAINDMKEAELSTGILPTAEPIAFVRRYVMKDGSIETNPAGRHTEVERRCAEADNNVRLCRFTRKDATDIALVNFSTHPDIIHKELFSADWPGFVRRFVEKDIENVSCLVTVGAQGDSNHADFMAEKIKDGYEHSRHMGRVIADSVLEMWNCSEKRNVEKITAGYDIVYNRTRTEGEERYEECKKIKEEQIKDPFKHHITVMGDATRIVNLRNQPIYQKIPMTVINLGDVGFVGFGGEPFTDYARAIQEACPNRFIVASCCTNGGEGYLPTEKAFAEGGYEVACSPFSKSIQNECVNMALELLKK